MIAARRSSPRLLALGLVLLAACTSTRLTTSWRAPGVNQIRFQKMVAFVVANEEALRRNGEEELCAQIARTPCVPAFRVVPDDAIADADRVKGYVASGGFDGAVVMRLVGRRVEQTYVPPTPAPMWGFYGASWAMAYDPGYVRQDLVVDVETCIYSVKDGRLLWTGTTESTNPHDVRRTVKEIAAAVAGELRREGLIPEE